MPKIIPKIEYFTRLVKGFWLIILIASLVGCVLGGVASVVTYMPEYEMTQAFTIEIKEHPDANDATVSESQLSKTIPALLSSDTFIEYMAPIIRQAGASGKFRITSLETSNIFYITCVARSNNDAQIIINEIQEHYTDLADYVIGESNMKFLAPPTYSKAPINTPKYTISALIGLLAGGVLVCAIFALISLLSNTVTDPSEIEGEINTKCLAVVKRVYEKKRSNEKNVAKHLPLVTDEKADFDFKKSISTLSANVHQGCTQNDFKAILVTSTVSGEGKSTIALSLALDLADKGQKVAIIDYDLRSPSLAEYMGIETVENPLSKAIKAGDYKHCLNKTSFPNLYFCGNPKEDSQSFDTIRDDVIEKLVTALKQSFDYVIIDTAPVGFLGDAISVSNAADCFLYVASYNSVQKSSIIRCISLLNETNHNMLGFVLNNK